MWPAGSRLQLGLRCMRQELHQSVDGGEERSHPPTPVLFSMMKCPPLNHRRGFWQGPLIQSHGAAKHQSSTNTPQKNYPGGSIHYSTHVQSSSTCIPPLQQNTHTRTFSGRRPPDPATRDSDSPMMPLSGVRSSWLMVERKSSLRAVCLRGEGGRQARR